MNSWKNFNGVLVLVVVGCLLFLGFQYFMAHENGQALMEEKAYERQTHEKELENLTNSSPLDEYIRFVKNTQDPDNIKDYTQTAYAYLTDALESMEDEENVTLVYSKVTAIQDRLFKFEEAEATQRPDRLKPLLKATTNAFQSIDFDQNSDIEKEVDNLAQKAEVFDDKASKEERLGQEKAYFKQVAAVLELMESKI